MTSFDAFLQACDYKLTETGKFCWTCWPHAWSYIANNDHGYITAIANPQDDVIYEITAVSHSDKKPYRWLNPQWVDAFKAECNQRRVAFSDAGKSEVYADTESMDDILDKGHAILHGLDFDERVVISLDMSSAEILKLALAAHNSQVSLNDFIIQVVKDVAAESL
jgi:hypothetical protein